LFVLSCSKDKVVTDDTSVDLGKITKIESLKSIQLGQNDTISVTFSGGANGCYKPHHLDATSKGFTTIFKAYYYVPGQPTVCPENIPVHTLLYIFKPTSKGKYIFHSFDTNVSATTIVN
jgi:hypothetical protein